MGRFCAIALLGCGTVGGQAAPIRESHGYRGPMEEKPSIALNMLPKDQTATFGDWIIGHTPDEHGIILVHRPSKLAVYLPWASNGWVNYRGTDGISQVLYSRGAPSPQGRDYNLDKLLAKPSPPRLSPGACEIQQWTVTVTEDSIQFHCKAMNCRMIIPRFAGNFTHNNRTIGGQ